MRKNSDRWNKKIRYLYFDKGWPFKVRKKWLPAKKNAQIATTDTKGGQKIMASRQKGFVIERSCL